MKNFIRICLLLPLIAQSHFLHAQKQNTYTSSDYTEKPNILEITLAAQLGFPQGDFKEIVGDRIARGGNLTLMINPSRKDNFFQFGFDLSAMHFDKAKHQVVDDKLKTTNTYFGIHGVGRLRMQTESVIRPYVDFMLGAKTFYTITRIDLDLNQTMSGDYESEILKEGYVGTISFGGAMGLTILLGAVNIDLSIKYLPGGPLEYIDPSTLSVDRTRNIDYERKSINRTDMIMAHIGINIWL
jgi:hypothetical protein